MLYSGSTNGIHVLYRFYFVSPKADAKVRFCIGWEDIYSIAFNTKRASLEFRCSSCVQRIDKFVKECLSADHFSNFQIHNARVKCFRIPHSVQTRDGCNYNYVAAP